MHSTTLEMWPNGDNPFCFCKSSSSMIGVWEVEQWMKKVVSTRCKCAYVWWRALCEQGIHRWFELDQRTNVVSRNRKLSGHTEKPPNSTFIGILKMRGIIRSGDKISNVCYFFHETDHRSLYGGLLCFELNNHVYVHVHWWVYHEVKRGGSKRNKSTPSIM